MSTAQLAAVSYLARYAGHTHTLYPYQSRQWFAWCVTNGLDPLVGFQRTHVELYIRGLGDRGRMDSWVVTMMHAVRGYFRFGHIDDLSPSDPAVYARLPKVHRDDSGTHGLDRLELIRFLQVAQTITVHHGALAYLLGINALRASEAAAVRIEDYTDTLRGHRVLHVVGKGNKPKGRGAAPPDRHLLRVGKECFRKPSIPRSSDRLPDLFAATTRELTGSSSAGDQSHRPRESSPKARSGNGSTWDSGSDASPA